MIDLKSILKQHPNCLGSRTSFKSVLMDRYPSEKRMVNILTILFECGIASKIQARKALAANEMQSLIIQTENEYGISAQYSQEAIMIWAEAYGVKAERIKLHQQKTVDSSVPIRPNPPSNTVYNPDYPSTRPAQPQYSATGSSSDYEVVRKTDGYYISRFKGFEEDAMIIPNVVGEKEIVGITREAFRGCNSVKKLCLSEGIKVLENGAFSDCSSLTTILLPSTLTTIGSQTSECKDGVFASTKIEKIVIPDSVTYMGPYTFWYCRQLKQVELSNNLEEIEVALFVSCPELVSVKMPSKLKRIKTAAFNDCHKFKEAHIPIGTRVIEENAFKGSGLSAIYIPPSVTSIGTTTSAPNWFTRLSWGRDETLGGYGTVYCEAGTAAYDFARKNNMKCAKAQF